MNSVNVATTTQIKVSKPTSTLIFSRDRMAYVYMFINNLNHKVYIGITTNIAERYQTHRNNAFQMKTHRYSIFYRDLYNYRDDFEFKWWAVKNFKIAKELEQQLIEKATDSGIELYNRSTGGELTLGPLPIGIEQLAIELYAQGLLTADIRIITGINNVKSLAVFKLAAKRMPAPSTSGYLVYNRVSKCIYPCDSKMDLIMLLGKLSGERISPHDFLTEYSMEYKVIPLSAKAIQLYREIPSRFRFEVKNVDMTKILYCRSIISGQLLTSFKTFEEAAEMLMKLTQGSKSRFASRLQEQSIKTIAAKLRSVAYFGYGAYGFAWEIREVTANDYLNAYYKLGYGNPVCTLYFKDTRIGKFDSFDAVEDLILRVHTEYRASTVKARIAAAISKNGYMQEFQLRLAP